MEWGKAHSKEVKPPVCPHRDHLDIMIYMIVGGAAIVQYCRRMERVRLCLFGAGLTHTRKRLKLSRYEVARRSGFSEEYLYKLEKSFREPKVGTVVRLGRALGIPPGELVNEMDRLMREAEENAD